MAIPYNVDWNSQYPFRDFADLVLVDVGFAWGDGGGGYQYEYIESIPAQHWCRQELECVKEFVERKGIRWDIDYCAGWLQQ